MTQHIFFYLNLPLFLKPHCTSLKKENLINSQTQSLLEVGLHYLIQSLYVSNGINSLCRFYKIKCNNKK